MDSTSVERVTETFSDPVVLLANGPFPTHPNPLNVLNSAGTLICCDGAADNAIKNGFTPHVIIGDLDSLSLDPSSFAGKLVRIEKQNNTDLEKALDWCIENQIKKVTLLGATGDREDHTLANLFLMRTFSNQIEIEMITDRFIIYYTEKEKTFSTDAGRKISLQPLGSETVISSSGLKYNLDHELLKTGGHGISNEAAEKSFTISVEKGSLLVFIAHSS